MAAEEAPDDSDQGWVERVEGRRALVAGVVAVLGDRDEHVTIPACPDVGEYAQVMRSRDHVRTPRDLVGHPVDEQRGGQRRQPDREAAPQEEIENT